MKPEIIKLIEEHPDLPIVPWDEEKHPYKGKHDNELEDE